MDVLVLQVDWDSQHNTASNSLLVFHMANTITFLTSFISLQSDYCEVYVVIVLKLLELLLIYLIQDIHQLL